MKLTYVSIASGMALALTLATPAMAAEHKDPGMQTPQAMEESMPGMATGAAAQGRISKRVDQVIGTWIVDSEGTPIGEVESIVQDKGTDQLHAQITVGGFLGIGGTDVVVPLNSLQPQGDRFLTPLAASKEDLLARPAYAEEMYLTLPGEKMVVLGSTATDEIAGTEKGVPGEAFQALDANQDGFLSRSEVSGQSGLPEQWNRFDQNRDERLDRAEFSAFEAAGESASPMEGGAPGMQMPRQQYDGPP